MHKAHQQFFLNGVHGKQNGQEHLQQVQAEFMSKHLLMVFLVES